MFHITTRDAWEAARTAGTYRAQSLETEGFIHFSLASQLAGTAQRYYAGVGDLIVLCVDEAGLDVRIEGGFPHLYEPLPVAAVMDVMPLEDALARAGG
jgi:uncharacterized protein (DUF952 family)